MNYLDTQLEYAISRALDGDKIACKRLFEQFINYSNMKERHPSPQLVNYIAKKLHELAENDFNNAKSIFGIQGGKELRRTKSFLRDYQLILDVNFCIENKMAEGAEGACKKLLESDFYKKFANTASLSAHYRRAVKQLETSYFCDDDYYAERISRSSMDAADKGKIMAESACFFPCTTSSPFEAREGINPNDFEMMLLDPNEK